MKNLLYYSNFILYTILLYIDVYDISIRGAMIHISTIYVSCRWLDLKYIPLILLVLAITLKC